MADWQKDLTEMLETIANQVEEFFFDVAEEVTDAMSGFVEFSEEVSTQLNTTFLDEVEDYITQLVSPVLEAYFGVGGAIEEVTQPFTQTVEPLLKQHPVCAGCRHFHGQYYGESFLVCGMHPYGVEAEVETCSDKEAVNWGMFYSDDREGL
jgi:hypothetical protein